MCHSMCWAAQCIAAFSASHVACFFSTTSNGPRLQVQKFMSFSQLRPQKFSIHGFLCEKRFPLAVISDAKAGVLALSREAAANAVAAEAFLMRWIGFQLSRSEKGRSEHDTEMESCIFFAMC